MTAISLIIRINSTNLVIDDKILVKYYWDVTESRAHKMKKDPLLHP